MSARPFPSSLQWDEEKRLVNLEKHGLDFADAPLVLDSPYRLDVGSVRVGEVASAALSRLLA